jgi:uncharacterized membrane protein YfcA
MAKKEKKAKKAKDPNKMGRRQQIVETYRMTKRVDKRIGWILLGTFLVFGAVGFVLLYLIPPRGLFGLIMAIISGALIGLLATTVIFGRRAQRSAYAQMEGQLGGGGSGARSSVANSWSRSHIMR